MQALGEVVVVWGWGGGINLLSFHWCKLLFLCPNGGIFLVLLWCQFFLVFDGSLHTALLLSGMKRSAFHLVTVRGRHFSEQPEKQQLFLYFMGTPTLPTHTYTYTHPSYSSGLLKKPISQINLGLVAFKLRWEYSSSVISANTATFQKVNQQFWYILIKIQLRFWLRPASSGRVLFFSRAPEGEEGVKYKTKTLLICGWASVSAAPSSQMPGISPSIKILTSFYFTLNQSECGSSLCVCGGGGLRTLKGDTWHRGDTKRTRRSPLRNFSYLCLYSCALSSKAGW